MEASFRRRIVLEGSAAGGVGAALAKALGAPVGARTVERFPDSELHVVVREAVAGAEVVLVQSLVAPAAEHLLELTLLADGCRRAGAASAIAVVPYFAYARQDRTSAAGEALGGPCFARLLEDAGVASVVAVDLHAEAAEGWFRVPVRHVTAMPLLAGQLGPIDPRAVIVSPDLGGAKRADRLARALQRPLAVAHKVRRSGSQVTSAGVMGDVRDRPVVLVDDLIATGGTLEAAIAALRRAGCADDVTVAATHAVLGAQAVDRLAGAGIRRLVCTDSVPPRGELPFPVTVAPLAPLLAEALGASQLSR